MADSEQGSASSSLRDLYHFMPRRRRRQFVLLLGLMIAGGLAELVAIGSVVPFLALLAGRSGWEQVPWLGELFGFFGAADGQERLAVAAMLFMAAALIAGALRLQLAWSTQRFALGLGHELSVEIQRRILLQPYSYHVGHNSSEVIAALDQVDALVAGVLLQLMQAITSVLIAGFIVVALVQIDPFTALAAAAAFAAVYTVISLTVRRRLARNSAILGAAYEQRVRLVQESLGGIRDVIIDGSQAVYVDAFREVDSRFADARAANAFIAAAPRLIVEAAGIVLVAALALAISGREGGFAAAVPILGAVALGAQRLLPLVQQLYHSWTMLAGNRAVVARVTHLLGLPVPTPPEKVVPLPFADSIVLDRVSYTYETRQQPALRDVSLTIPRGSRAALVGRTGSGKSTLADLLMGLLEPSAGRILVDGVPLTADNRRSWQRSIAHVPQSVFLADTSIARNIAVGTAKAVDIEAVRVAARVAQLDDFIESLPEGYDTRVGERGVRLSGGQRQRLAIARAVYKEASVLVLDEATSALDPETEQAVLNALDQLGREGRTIVIIAHRPSTAERCDLVARLDNGRLVEVEGGAESNSRTGTD